MASTCPIDTKWLMEGSEEKERLSLGICFSRLVAEVKQQGKGINEFGEEFGSIICLQSLCSLKCAETKELIICCRSKRPFYFELYRTSTEIWQFGICVCAGSN